MRKSSEYILGLAKRLKENPEQGLTDKEQMEVAEHSLSAAREIATIKFFNEHIEKTGSDVYMVDNVSLVISDEMLNVLMQHQFDSICFERYAKEGLSPFEAHWKTIMLYDDKEFIFEMIADCLKCVYSEENIRHILGDEALDTMEVDSGSVH